MSNVSVQAMNDGDRNQRTIDGLNLVERRAGVIVVDYFDDPGVQWSSQSADGHTF